MWNTSISKARHVGDLILQNDSAPAQIRLDYPHRSRLENGVGSQWVR
jgi:hypothetical protein